MKKFFFAIAAIAAITVSCGKSDPEPTPTPDPEPVVEKTDVLFVPIILAVLAVLPEI